jgi:glycosyltransferase involved in cell wall biosynthesis
LNRLVIPSGVPRHIIEVVGDLLRDPSLRISFLANAAEAEKYLPTQGPLWTGAPRVVFPQPVALMARRWGILNSPGFEKLGGSAEWVYLPADAYVPVERAKLAVTIHDVYKLEPPAPGENRWDHYKARLRHWVVYRRVASAADRIFTVSRFSADRIIHHLGVPASRIEIVYNGVSPAFFHPDATCWPQLRDEFGIVDGQPFFVHMGGLKAKKNGPGIIAAWREFEARRPDARLVLLGHHDEDLVVVARRELRHALFPPRLGDAQMAALLARSAGLFFPSFYEGFGIPVVEAMAAGAPLVLSDIPALRELAGDLAFYANPSEPRQMAEALARCVSGGSSLAARLAEGKSLANQFTWAACAGRVKQSFTR